MQTYLRRVGAVGRPRIRSMRVFFNAQMRSSTTSPWMQSTATQYEFFDPPARLFYMNATRSGVPFDVFHRYIDSAARFQVRIASLFSMVDKSVPVLTRADTVTLMNDIVGMAPAAVLDLPFTWKTVGERSLLATFTNAGDTVSAALTFDAAGDLVGFLSNDRTQEDAKGSRNVPWSTSISGHRESMAPGSAPAATRTGSRRPGSGPTVNPRSARLPTTLNNNDLQPRCVSYPARHTIRRAAAPIAAALVVAACRHGDPAAPGSRRWSARSRKLSGTISRPPIGWELPRAKRPRRSRRRS